MIDDNRPKSAALHPYRDADRSALLLGDYAAAWSLRPWSADEANSVQLPSGSRQFLMSYGLPRGEAEPLSINFMIDPPFLRVGGASTLVQIGFFGPSCILCFDEADGTVKTAGLSGDCARPINGSIEHLAMFMMLYVRYEAEANGRGLSTRARLHLCDRLEADLRRVDPLAFEDSEGGFWPIAIDETRSDLAS